MVNSTAAALLACPKVRPAATMAAPAVLDRYFSIIALLFASLLWQLPHEAVRKFVLHFNFTAR
jgi:hypothetical protein